MKNRSTTPILGILFILGLSLLLYPTVSNMWNNRHMSKVIEDYQNTVEQLDKKDYDKIWSDAVKYNQEMAKHPMNFIPSEEEMKRYKQILNVTDDGVMGTVEIPSVRCFLPIYHGTDEDTLQVACGHIEGSSLPVGGSSSHCVLSGHRGLPSATLFTNLDKLVEGDIFMVHVLDKTLTYEVDQIRTVLPEEVADLTIEEGKDQCTLVTCTPYGINTHRLLVRGKRVDNRLDINVPMDAMQIDTKASALLLALPMIIISVAALFIRTRQKKGKGKKC